MTRTPRPDWRAVALTLAALALGAASLSAQRPVAVRATPPPPPSIPILVVSPGEPPAPEAIQEGGENRFVHRLAGRPTPLDRAEKAALIRQLGGQARAGAAAVGGIRTAPGPRLDELTLTIRNPYVDQLGHLEFLTPGSVNTREGDATMRPNGGHVTARLNLEGGQTYLVDFSVYSGRQAEQFTLSGGVGGGHTLSALDGDQHLFVVLQPTASGWTWVSLYAKKIAYLFYSVEVTRVP